MPTYRFPAKYRALALRIFKLAAFGIPVCVQCGCASLEMRDLSTSASRPIPLPITKFQDAKSVRMGKFISTIPGDKVIGRSITSMGAPIMAANMNFSLQQMSSVVAREFSGRGIRVMGLAKDNLFGNEEPHDTTADLTIAAILVDASQDLEEIILELGNTHCQTRVVVEWHIYDNAEKKEVGVITSEGFAHTKGYEFMQSQSKAFAVCSNNLMANQSFIGLISPAARGLIKSAAAQGAGKVSSENAIADTQQADNTTPKTTWRNRTNEDRAQAAAVPKSPQVGDMAPDISFVRLSDGEQERLSDYAGKVCVIDFWAYWCPPCQGPTAKMQTYAEMHPEFGDKVVFIECSVDKDKKRLMKHLEKKGWNKTHNVWDDDNEHKAFDVYGIPAVFIIGTDGIIAAKGHPGKMDIPGIVAKLLEKSANKP